MNQHHIRPVLVLALLGAVAVSACRDGLEPLAGPVEDPLARTTPGAGAPAAPAPTTPSGSASAPSPAPEPPSTPPMPGQGEAAAPAVTATATVRGDADVLAVLAAANRSEIEQAQLAQSKAKNPTVRQFAGRMMTKHQSTLLEGEELAVQLRMMPTDNPVAQTITSTFGSSLQTLQQAPAEQFDRVFLESQVREHRELLRIIDEQLRPHAQNALVKQHLDAMQQAALDHLQRAEQIQSRVAER